MSVRTTYQKSKKSKGPKRSMVQRRPRRSASGFGDRVKGIKEVKEVEGIKELDD